eukprot:Phypoly_transcript_13133.p1 GENE.Phypoly_transcript_13133~~Phypoly_transcript_13133.p1  ORF type:complete len:200 (-),score=40.73 Phypoly_transcript_13133:346-945(-)
MKGGKGGKRGIEGDGAGGKKIEWEECGVCEWMVHKRCGRSGGLWAVVGVKWVVGGECVVVVSVIGCGNLVEGDRSGENSWWGRSSVKIALMKRTIRMAYMILIRVMIAESVQYIKSTSSKPSTMEAMRNPIAVIMQPNVWKRWVKGKRAEKGREREGRTWREREKTEKKGGETEAKNGEEEVRNHARECWVKERREGRK